MLDFMTHILSLKFDFLFISIADKCLFEVLKEFFTKVGLSSTFQGVGLYKRNEMVQQLFSVGVRKLREIDKSFRPVYNEKTLRKIRTPFQLCIAQKLRFYFR